MTSQDMDDLRNDFALALQQKAQQERLVAIQKLIEKSVQLGVAIDQPTSKDKPLDIAFAALDLALYLMKAARGDVMNL